MKTWQNLKKWFGKATSKQQEGYYNFDDIILYNWLKCADGKVNYCRVNASTTDKIRQKDLIEWDRIYCEYIDTMGLNGIYKQFLLKSKKKALIELDYVITRSKFLTNALRVIDVELEKLKEQMNKGITTEQVLVHLSKYMGYRQDPKKITFKEYLNLIKEYERAN